ncbi:MAG: ParA family protein [Myxococcales bacterium]|nr:ParA family protein [Myxococcales bacterium]
MSCCDVCGSEFEVRFRYQVREDAGRYVYVCSARCQRELLLGGGETCACAVCEAPVEVEYPHQVAVRDGERAYFCSLEHRNVWERSASAPAPAAPDGPRRIAVFNHKGGTGKTTTAVNLAAGIAETGKRVLLVDADGQGNVGASLGISGEKTLYHVLVNGLSVEEAVVPVRTNLDVLTSNETLAAAELYLAQRPNRDRVLRERMGDRAAGWDVVVIDCAPALSLMNQNALVYADSVVVPVACDYLSLVGVRQVLRTLKNVQRLLRHEVELLGVLPTFYDVRNRISREALTSLQTHFGDRCFLPVRVNTKLREAPSAKQTIFEYASESHGASDYLKLVERLFPKTRPMSEPAVSAVRMSFARPAMSA